ncbi:MAG: acyltransferase [Clostridia bacterium]|nr:acyltransferase [Clostridia bacterium]
MKYRKHNQFLKKQFDIRLLSEYRNRLFGIAILSIIVYHGFEDVMQASKEGLLFSGALMSVTGAYNNLIGSIGVEIFVFLSGMGLYFSMKKNDAVLPFYKRRGERLVKPYILSALVYWPVRCAILRDWDIPALLLNISTLSFWLNGVKNVWYIAFIAVMYLVYPLIFRLFEQKYALWFPVLLLGSFAAVFLLRHFLPAYYNLWEIALWRIPVFILGAGTGVLVYRQVKVSWLWIGVLLFIGFGIKAARYFLRSVSFVQAVPFRLVSILFTPAVLVFLVFLLSLVKWKPLHAVLSWFGGISLELYLLHVMCRSLLNCIQAHMTSNLLIYYGMAAVSVLMSWGLFTLLNRKKKPDKAPPPPVVPVC